MSTILDATDRVGPILFFFYPVAENKIASKTNFRVVVVVDIVVVIEVVEVSLRCSRSKMKKY